MRSEFGKETFWLQILRNWKRMDASDVHAKRLNAGLRVRSWDVMLMKISTITGTLMEIANCQIRGQVSQDSPYWMQSHLMDIHGLGQFLALLIRWGNEGQRTAIVPGRYERPLDAPSAPRSSWQAIGQPDAATWKFSGTQGTSFWENSEAPLPPPKHRCNFVHPKQLSTCPERLKLTYPNGEILPVYEEDVSFIRDHFTASVKADPNDTLQRHRLMFERPSQNLARHLCEGKRHPLKNFFDSSIPNRSSVQKRLSIFNWNLGLRRGKRVLSRNELQENGTLSLCRRRLSMSTTSPSRTDST